MSRHYVYYLILGVLPFVSPLAAQYRGWDKVTVQVSADVKDSPPEIVLTWALYPDGGSYTIQRRTTGLNTPWGATLATLPNTATTWTDTDVESGAEYEYRINRSEATGYIQTGIRLPLKDQWGKVIFLIDDTMATPLAAELNDMERMMVADGWQVIRQNVSRTATVPQIKATILGYYQQDPTNTRALFLFGRIPVPYSGSIYPDGHREHSGAWPADVYYGDMDGTWTDSSVNKTSASHGTEPTRNHNIPGDGKFDQNHVPGTELLEVGRVDLCNLPKLKALGSETDLLRNYIRKNRQFRYKEVDYSRRMIIYGSGFENHPTRPAANGFRESPAFFGQDGYDRVEKDEFLPTLQNTSYLWARGDGPGHFQGASGVGVTQNFVGIPTSTDPVQQIAYDPRSPFFTICGSWFGDWDTRDNFLRAFLAAPGHSLTNAWVGFNHWFAQDLALGYNIGCPMRKLHLNQNKIDHGYTLPIRENSFYNGGARTHMALMGDPTLRIFVVAPPQNVAVNPQGQISWNPSPDSSIVGYHIYRSAQELGPYSRLTSAPIASSNFTDPKPVANAWYMVRAIKFETTGSGTFYNASQGIMIQSSGNTAPNLITPGNASVQAGQTLQFSIDAVDPDSDPFTFSASGPQR